MQVRRLLPRSGPSSHRGDVAVVTGCVALVVAAIVVGQRTSHLGLSHAAPLTGPLRGYLPGPRYLLGVAAAVLGVVGLPVASRRLTFGRLLVLAWVAAVVFSMALAATDGAFGLFDRLSTRFEYLPSVPLVGSNPVTFLHGFAAHIVQHHDGTSWATHVAGHPPGTLLFFWSLAQVGLGGRVWASLAVVLVGASAAPAAMVAARAVAGEAAARAAMPFLVLAPYAIWIATSADALFLGVGAWGIAMLAVAGNRASTGAPNPACGYGLAGGLLLGTALFLSYGIAPLGLVALGAVLAHRARWPLVWAALGTAVVVGAYATAGFWWIHGVEETHTRVYQGLAATRPSHYFIWGNLAALVIAVGPAVMVALTRLARHQSGRLGWLAVPALAAVLILDVSGLSKGEVERIWLPFMPWLTVATATLARQRGRTPALPAGDEGAAVTTGGWPVADRRWLAVQAVTALVIEAVVLGKW